MSDAAQKIEVELPFIRRYQTADIMKQAHWLFPRLARLFPHMSREAHYTWLLNMLNSNDCIPLYHECGFALAMMMSEPMRPNAYVEEVFVYLQDAAQPEQQIVGAHFYNHFYSWTTQRGIKTLFIEKNTDVSRKSILEVTGSRVFESNQAYMRV